MTGVTTRIDFYLDSPDKLQTVSRLVQKALGLAHRLVVLVPDAEAEEAIDRLLWTQPPTGFIPHCRAGSRLVAETPVVITHDLGRTDIDDVLVNLGPEIPDHFDRFRRVIEIVGCDEADKAPARERYRLYRDQGHELHRHSLAAN